MARVTPMLHVPDVRATVAWYVALGFTLVETAEDDGEPTWAMLAYGDARLMLNAGGAAREVPRRDADLYLDVDDLDALFASLPPEVVVREPPHDTFYGMRELIVRDDNGFWLTFGQPLTAHQQELLR